jgi:hypothetical protein
MLCIIDDIAFSWRLTPIKRRLGGNNGFADPLLGSSLYPDRTFAASMVDRLMVDLDMPEMVADQFVLQGSKGVGGICR